jgi:aspartyl-tRNA(Asn)/glutamyl-tRNA(Gln) amidotransferase subunit C
MFCQFNNLQDTPQGDVYDFAHIFRRKILPFMSLDRAQIQTIAHLARLNLTEAEIPVYQESLSRIVDLVSQLDRAETRDVAPMAHPLPGLAQRLRADEVLEADKHEQFQRNAPQVEAGLYLVPRVIE